MVAALPDTSHHAGHIAWGGGCVASYVPVSVVGLCNVAAGVVGPKATDLLGDADFRGLPFCIGDSEHGTVALFGPGGHLQAGSVAISRTAFTITFAHVLLDTAIAHGGSPGGQVGRYAFVYADADRVEVPIRDRFEIGWISRHFTMRPGQPYLAIPDGDDGMQPRYEGPYDEKMRRISEVSAGSADAYFLWTWSNPRPNVPIQSVEVVGGPLPWVLGGMSLGLVDELPLERASRRPLHVEVTQSENTDQSGDLEVHVDRGVATYTQPLPRDPAAFLDAVDKGWGEENNRTGNPAYTEVSAVPSANVRVTRGGEVLGTARFGDLQGGSVVEVSPKLKLSMPEIGRNWVHTRVIDADSGKPVPCRVHFRSPEGIPYQPYGHHPHLFSGFNPWGRDLFGDVRMDQVTYAYIDGTCQGWLPRGRVVVDVARGFEYEPLRTVVNIQPGQRHLELQIGRWINMNERGWFSGDTHVHFLAGNGAILESSGEDLNVANVLQSQWGHMFSNTDDFTGRPHVSEDGRTIVSYGQENRQHFLGHLNLLGLTEPVMPWCTDGPGEAELGGPLQTTMSHWAEQCRAQGGTVVLPHFPWPNGDPVALIASGLADAVEMCRQVPFDHDEYYRYLNAGYRLPLVGGTDKMTADTPVGIYRTYVQMPGEMPFTYDGWRSQLATGRTFMSSGPIIGLSVEGHEIGDTVVLRGNGGAVHVEAWAEGSLPIHSLQIVQEGRVVGETVVAEGTRRLELSERLKIDGHTWFAARTGGPTYYDAPYYLDSWHRQRFAHTSPIYVSTGGDWHMWNDATAQYMLTMIDGNLSYVRRRASSEPTDSSVTHHHGEDDHAAYLERPLLAARAAIHHRMHALGIAH